MRSYGKSLRPNFVEQVEHATKALGIDLSWYSDYWVARLGKGAIVRHIVGYTFSINNAASAQIATDKVAASSTLIANDIPAVAHTLLRFAGLEPNEWPRAVLDFMRLPIVAKPNFESGGIDVCRARTLDELAHALTSLAQRYRVVALSPFIEVKDEYRVVVLDDNAVLVYRKVLAGESRTDEGESEWRHNLRLDARPELLDSNAQVYRELQTLARSAMQVLGLRFAAIDIISVSDGLLVLEANSSFALEHFSRASRDYARLVSNIYVDAIARCFELG